MTIGKGFTETVAIVDPEQTPLIPLIVNEELLIGEINKEVPKVPLLHVYVLAPVTVSVTVCPIQIVGLFTISVRFGFTETVVTAVFVQPAVVPVTL